MEEGFSKQQAEVGAHMKMASKLFSSGEIGPYIPLLQEEKEIVKLLSDQNHQVRLKAATDLNDLIVIQKRSDAIFNELNNRIKTTNYASVREMSLNALRGVMTPAGDKMSETIRKSILTTLQSMLSHPEEDSRMASARCLGALFRHQPADELEALDNDCLIHDDPSMYWTLHNGKSACLSVALKEALTIQQPHSNQIV
jgi:hypothetical protein